MIRVALAVLVMVMMALMTACGGGGGDGTTGPTPPPVNSGVATVTVAVSPAQLTVGATTTATAELRSSADAVLTGRTVNWSSSAPTIAAVNGAGVVSAVAAGSATITATSEGKSGSAPITVVPAPVATVAITLALPSLTLGATTTATAVLRDERGAVLADRAITWSSTSPSVATVSQTGAITTVQAGTTTITASSEGKSASATLTVLPVPIATITVTLGASPIVIGTTTVATAVLRDANGALLTGRPLAFTSANSAVATVSTTGTVTAVSTGTTVISVTSGDKAGNASITVIDPPVASVSIAGPATLAPGASAGYTATPRDVSGAALSNRTVAWSSSDASVATVSASGNVTALTPGITTIAATSEGQRGSVMLTVRYNIATVTVTGSSRVKVGDAYTYTVVAKLADGTVVNRPIGWNIAEPNRATVTNAGVVTPLQTGAYTLEVFIDGERWTSSYTAYDWSSFSVDGTSFASLDADATVTNKFGTSAYPRLVVACSDGMFFLWVSMSNITTANGIVAYSFDSAAPVAATWRELSPDYETLWHPGPFSLTKAFAAQIVTSRRFAFAFGEYNSGTRSTAFRTGGLTSRVAPLYAQCPNNSIVAAPNAPGDQVQVTDTPARVMAAYRTARGETATGRVSETAAARAIAGPAASEPSALLRAWPVWTTSSAETRQAKRVR